MLVGMSIYEKDVFDVDKHIHNQVMKRHGMRDGERERLLSLLKVGSFKSLEKYYEACRTISKR